MGAHFIWRASNAGHFFLVRRYMHVVYVSSVCPNSQRFLGSLQRIPSLRDTTKIVNVDHAPPSMHPGIEFVPTLVDSSGVVFVGEKCFEFLKQFNAEMEVEPMAFGGAGALAYSSIDAEGVEYSRNYSPFEKFD
jgi:hypothetical protein